VAIRSLKRFVTDRVDPSVWRPEIREWDADPAPRVAVVGSGPAGLSAAHQLSLAGCLVTVFEAETEPGGMLYCAIPSYRLPRETIQSEVQALLNDNITVVCNSALGRDFSVDSLFEDGFQAVLLAIGAHRSRPLGIAGEDSPGVIPSIQFLKAFNLRGEQLAHGKVGVIGGGNSAVDAARTALRQRDVEEVTILYRRTRKEMPAFAEEIEAALEEGVALETLVSPQRILTADGALRGLECVRNRLGTADTSGRRRPVPLEGSEHERRFDTLIVAISEDSGVDCVTPAADSGIEITEWNTVKVDERKLSTSRHGVFAAGDVVTGPNTIVDAIAAGKRSAAMIEAFLRGKQLAIATAPSRPSTFVPALATASSTSRQPRVEAPRASVDWRRRNFAEVEVGFSVAEARCEAERCLRCDLEFTAPSAEAAGKQQAKG
jgi:NADH-quinone oxidoreductase subunit F